VRQPVLLRGGEPPTDLVRDGLVRVPDDRTQIVEGGYFTAHASMMLA
jgi:hypothetical protein